MQTLRTRIDGESGFTLIELLITAVLIGVVAALAVPSLQTAYDRQVFKSGYQEMLSNLKEARSSAITDKIPYGVHFDQESRTITVFQNSSNPSTPSLDDGDKVMSKNDLPQQFQYVYCDMENSAIVFRPNGSAQLVGYGNIFLAGETKNMMAYYSTSVLASTGRIATYSQYYKW